MPVDKLYSSWVGSKVVVNRAFLRKDVFKVYVIWYVFFSNFVVIFILLWSFFNVFEARFPLNTLVCIWIEATLKSNSELVDARSSLALLSTFWLWLLLNTVYFITFIHSRIIKKVSASVNISQDVTIHLHQIRSFANSIKCNWKSVSYKI